MSSKETLNNKNLNNNSDGKVKRIMGNLCGKSGDGTKKATSGNKALSKAPLKRNCCDVCVIGTSSFLGFMFLTLGILTIVFPLYEHVQNEHLTMKSYYPDFIWWKNPEPEVLLKVYLFNITNSEDFIAGKDQKLKLQEIGPIVFRELAENRDIVWHKENSTMSYTVSRRLVFKESANIEGILNQTIFAPNMALSAASYISNNFFLRRSLNLLLRSYSTPPVVSATIYNYLFNLTDPVLELAHNLVPFIAPTKDTGVLHNIYRTFTDRVNVNIGTKHGPEQFFKMNFWNDRATVPRFYTEYGDCNASLQGATEGSMYPSKIKKDSVLWYWRKTLCRPVPLHFEKEVRHHMLTGYKFVLRFDVFDRFEKRTDDCYQGDNLPNGLSDLSRCFYDQPIVASFPHFCNTTGPWEKYLDGLTPNETLHQSYSIVEPVFGAPLNQRARSQSNVALKDLSGFKKDFARFSNMIIPMFWLEYHQEDITPIILSTLNFIVNILPKIQFLISGGLIIIGLCLLMMGYLRLRRFV